MKQFSDDLIQQAMLYAHAIIITLNYRWTVKTKMPQHTLQLPPQLKQEAELWAAQQGISLDQFVLRAVAEKIGASRYQSDDPAFPQITYRQGSSGESQPVLRGTGIRVQTIVFAAQQWYLLPAQIAIEYDLTEAQTSIFKNRSRVINIICDDF